MTMKERQQLDEYLSMFDDRENSSFLDGSGTSMTSVGSSSSCNLPTSYHQKRRSTGSGHKYGRDGSGGFGAAPFSRKRIC